MLFSSFYKGQWRSEKLSNLSLFVDPVSTEKISNPGIFNPKDQSMFGEFFVVPQIYHCIILSYNLPINLFASL
jgi:hypothetical protein